MQVELWMHTEFMRDHSLYTCCWEKVSDSEVISGAVGSRRGRAHCWILPSLLGTNAARTLVSNISRIYCFPPALHLLSGNMYGAIVTHPLSKSIAHILNDHLNFLTILSTHLRLMRHSSEKHDQEPTHSKTVPDPTSSACCFSPAHAAQPASRPPCPCSLLYPTLLYFFPCVLRGDGLFGPKRNNFFS